MEQLSDVNRHHLAYQKRHWRKSEILYKLRSHQGMIIPMDIYDHRELHHDLGETPMPHPHDAEELLDYLGEYDSMAERIDYLDMAANFMTERSPAYAGHLLLQRSYILLTPFTQVERNIVAQQMDMERDSHAA